MISLLAAVLLAQAPGPVKVVVIDISQPDAIYEDISRGYAEEVTEALNQAGFSAYRIDERELPDEGCRAGPCLAKVAVKRESHVLVALDATEVDKEKNGVALTALRGKDGMPLASARFTLTEKTKRPLKPLEKFVADLKKSAAKNVMVKP